jgi:hypothetical protein
MLRAPLVSWSRMVASIPNSYQVHLTGSYRLTGLFSQLGGLVQPKGWIAFGHKRKLKGLFEAVVSSLCPA